MALASLSSQVFGRQSIRPYPVVIVNRCSIFQAQIVLDVRTISTEKIIFVFHLFLYATTTKIAFLTNFCKPGADVINKFKCMKK